MTHKPMFESEQIALNDVITADDDDFVLGFGPRLSVLRKRAGMSTGDLATCVGMSKTIIERYEAGLVAIDLVTLKDFDVVRLDRNFILDGHSIDHYVETNFDWYAMARIAGGIANQHKQQECPNTLDVLAAALRTMYRAHRQRERSKR
ncbi:MAG: helix-turn-helix domain-containing protein [Gammaproteobacteria bacterium]